MMKAIYVGKISQSSVHNFEWIIENFFSLPYAVGTGIRSPSFAFADKTWTMLMWPKGIELNCSEKWLAFGVSCKPLSSNYRLNINLRMTLDGETVFESQSGETDNNGQFLVPEWMLWSDIEEKRSKKIDGGHLTVFCKLSIINSPSAVTCSGANKVLQDLKRLLVSEEDSDVVLKVKGKSFKAHKNILKVRCPVFHSMFTHKMVEEESGVVVIDDCDPNTFPDFLHHIYTGKVESISAKNVFSLYKTADKYCIEDLKQDCSEFMKNNLSVDAFCDVLGLALLHKEDELIQLTTNFFTENYKKIILTVKWQNFLVEHPIEANELFIKSLLHGKE